MLSHKIKFLFLPLKDKTMSNAFLIYLFHLIERKILKSQRLGGSGERIVNKKN